MSLVSKWILGRLGRLRAVALSDPAAACIELPPPDRHGGLPLMQALALRHSERDFAETPLSLQQLSELLWAADGINRPEIHERTVTGLQDFVDAAPLDLVYVADDHRMRMIPERRRGSYSALCAGAIMQNVYLYCASAGLISVARGLFDEDALRQALGLSSHQRIIITQTVGAPRLTA
jgi:nitroreductase